MGVFVSRVAVAEINPASDESTVPVVDEETVFGQELYHALGDAFRQNYCETIYYQKLLEHTKIELESLTRLEVRVASLESLGLADSDAFQQLVDIVQDESLESPESMVPHLTQAVQQLQDMGVSFGIAQRIVQTVLEGETGKVWAPEISCIDYLNPVSSSVPIFKRKTRKTRSGVVWSSYFPSTEPYKHIIAYQHNCYRPDSLAFLRKISSRKMNPEEACGDLGMKAGQGPFPKAQTCLDEDGEISGTAYSLGTSENACGEEI